MAKPRLATRQDAVLNLPLPTLEVAGDGGASAKEQEAGKQGSESQEPDLAFAPHAPTFVAVVVSPLTFS